jgi:hypothetical protein
VKKTSFWLTVAGVSILANFALELAARKAPSAGLRRLAEFTHYGPGGQA